VRFVHPTIRQSECRPPSVWIKTRLAKLLGQHPIRRTPWSADCIAGLMTTANRAPKDIKSLAAIADAAIQRSWRRSVALLNTISPRSSDNHYSRRSRIANLRLNDRPANRRQRLCSGLASPRTICRYAQMRGAHGEPEAKFRSPLGPMRHNGRPIPSGSNSMAAVVRHFLLGAFSRIFLDQRGGAPQ